MGQKSPLAVVATGGHVLNDLPSSAGLPSGHTRLSRIGLFLTDLVRLGYRIVVTHGNGPQVGLALLRSEHSAVHAAPLSLNLCVATTQGEIGYLLQQTIRETLRVGELEHAVATVVTQVIVDADDPAWRRPTKPIGPFYTRDQAVDRRRTEGWMIVSDLPQGYRRVVASPRPVEVVEMAVVEHLCNVNVVVIAAGGAESPSSVVDNELHGVDAVVDKDHTSALLAIHLGARLYVNVTSVERAYVDFPTSRERGLGRVTPEEMRHHLREGHFPDGTMGPKVESALEFLDHGGAESIITSSEHLDRVLRAEADVGTRIVQE